MAQSPNAADWDSALANLGGHPLQSALWGDARRKVDGIDDQRWIALRGGKPIWMVRFEERRVPILGGVAWAPRGPTGQAPELENGLPSPLRAALAEKGMTVAITDPWRKAVDDPAQGSSQPGPRTMWVDLAGGKDQVWGGLHKQFKQGIRKAQRASTTIEAAATSGDIERFFRLCEGISNLKGFTLPGSLSLMLRLFEIGHSGDVETKLFVARRAGRLSAGVFIIRCGQSAHFFWGGTDRGDSKEGVGEAAHWAAIEWSLAKGCRIYDLEGIDPERNPGVYFFKKKLGGSEIKLAGKHYYPFNSRGRLVAWLEARRR